MTDHCVHLGNCLVGMEEMPPQSVDCVLTDPPYSEHVHNKQRRGLAEKVTSLGFAHLSDGERRGAAMAFGRITRRWVIVFCAIEDAGRWAADLEFGGLEYIRTGAWVKPDGMPQFSGDRPAVGFEALVVAHRPGKKRWNGGGRHELWMFPKGEGVLARHETQKPLALMEALVRDFTDPGDLVCDPFAGSGSTLVAAKHLGRRALGWEIDPRSHAIARRRLAGTREQLGLFAGGA